MSDNSSFLFARPTFAEGMGRIFDFGNTLTEYNRSLNERQADEIALEMDWAAVGDGLRAAMNQYARPKVAHGVK